MYSLDAFLKQYFIYHGVPPITDSVDGQDTLSNVSQLIHHPKTDHYWLTNTLSELVNMPWLDLDYFTPGKLSESAISETLLRQHNILPLFERKGKLYVGVANPFELAVLETIRFATQTSVHFILVEWPKLTVLREALLNNPQLPLQALSLPSPADDSAATSTNDSIEDAPLVRYVNQLLQQAIQKQSSDIHFEPQMHHLRIRFRIDGVLHAQPSPPALLADRILSRIKIMAQLDIAEKRLPQNGRFDFAVSDGLTLIDCRVSTCPTLFGEKIAVRLLSSEKTTLDITTLGLTKQQQDILIEGLSKPQGMLLVTGPTGSGKTLTLYSGLHYLNQPSVNIASVEDPVEIRLPGINQVTIHPKIGLDFATVLKVLLRQDPDIIMIGEMRDLITAQIGIQAAQTGHLVLSTLHTNSATETITRLLNMGIPTYHLVSSVNLIIAQRLARRLCTQCKQATTLSQAILAQHGIQLDTSLAAFKAAGCKHCTQGYKGRIGIFELLPITATLTECILQHKSTLAIEQQGQAEGMLNLKAAALKKLKEGVIDLAEMSRVMS